MNEEKSFAEELAELINRHSIDAKFKTADGILADVAIDALNAYYKAKVRQERRNNQETDDCDSQACPKRRTMEAKKADRPEPGKKEHRKPEAPDVPKEVQAIAEFFGKMFPGTKVVIHGAEMILSNQRDKRRGKNKRNGENNGKR